MKHDITLSGRESASVLDILNQILYHPDEAICVGSEQRKTLATVAFRMTHNDWATDHNMTVDEMTEEDFVSEYLDLYEA